MSTKKNIVILGGGFAGIRVALDLVGMRHMLDGYSIILVDRQKSHLFTPLLYEVASAFLFQEDPEPFSLDRGVAISYGLLNHIALQNAVKFVQADVTRIDREKREIICGKERTPYEYLVLALGSEPETFGTPGVPEHAWFFRSFQDAVGIHERITTLLAKRRTGQERRVTVVIGGGGPAGVELAAELAMFCKHACARYNLPGKDFEITVAQAAPRLLPNMHPGLSDAVRERLEGLGVTILLDTCIKEARKGEVVIAPRPLRPGESTETLTCAFGKDRERVIEADVMVWSAGVRAMSIPKVSGFLTDAKGRVDVLDTMEVKGETRVFALGDCSALLDPKTNQPLPGLAQVAIFQGRVVAANICRSIAKRQLAHYHFPFLAYVIPAGGKFAFAQLGRLWFSGRLAYLLYRIIDFKYFFSILPLGYAWKVWWAGWRAYSRND